MRKEDYVKYSFTKNFSSSAGNTEMLFRIHKGFESRDELERLLELKGYNLDCVVVVRFLNMYYGVIFEDYNRNYVIGKLKTYYVSNKFTHQGCNTKTFEPKFEPNFIKKQIYTHQTLADDLIKQDSKLDVFIKGRSILKYDYAKTYVVLLALTFVDYFFAYDEMYILNNYYFSEDYSDAFNKDRIGINPFKGIVKLHNDEIRQHQFYHGFVPHYKRNEYTHNYFMPTNISISFGDIESYDTIDESDFYYSIFYPSELSKNKNSQLSPKPYNVIYVDFNR